MNEFRYHQVCNYLEGNINPESLEDLNKWLAADSDHQAFFEQMKFMWNHAEIMPPLEDIQPIKTDANEIEAALQKVKEPFKNQKVKKSIPAQSIRRNLFLRIAAAAAIFLCLGYMGVKYWSTASPSLIEVATKSNEEKEVLLPDGSVAWLNPNSKLVYPKNFRKEKREVQAEGMIVFEVAHQENQPFVVESTHVDVTVLGTKFIVKSFSGASTSEVGVINGKVKVATKDQTQEIQLEQGMAAIFDESQNSLTEKTNFQFSQVFKITNELVFNNVQLNEVISEIEKAYQVEIELINKALKSCRFKGTFENKNIDQVLTVLQAVYDFKFETTTNKKYKIFEGLCN